MRIVVRYFAVARESAGVAREEVEVPEEATASEALGVIVALHPKLGAILGVLRIAVDRDFVELSTALKPGTELALVPPVAGGSRLCDVRAEPISLDEVVGAVSSPERGGVVTFTGAVRGQSRGRKVIGLHYEAYREMAIRQLDLIASQCETRFEAEVAILHRVGDLQVGEVAVVIAAAAAHREAAFDACRYAIEELKKDVTIWKKEAYDDGESWVGMGP